MINKENLWFLTLFSLILVLSVYYVTMPNDLLLNNGKTDVVDKKEEDDKVSVVVQESEILVALRVSLEEERMQKKADLEGVLTNNEMNTEAKNAAYEELKYLNIIVSQEEMLEAKVKEVHNMDSFVEIDNKEISVVIVAKNHDNALANAIMRTVQKEFTEQMYITVKFQ